MDNVIVYSSLEHGIRCELLLWALSRTFFHSEDKHILYQKRGLEHRSQGSWKATGTPLEDLNSPCVSMEL